MRTRASVSGTLLALTLAWPAQAAMESIYRDVKNEAGERPYWCEELYDRLGKRDDPPIGMRCPGPGAPTVWAWIEFGETGDAVKVGGEGTGLPFLPLKARIGPKVEWRDTDERPVALIARVRLGENGTQKANWLTVHRVDAEGIGCLYAIVDARVHRDANERARMLADRSASDECAERPILQTRADSLLRRYAKEGLLDRPDRSAAKGMYAKLDTANGATGGCETLAASDPDEGGEWASVRCPGPGGVWAHIEYADARDTLRVGEDGMGTPFLSDFTGFGPEIEWRMQGDVPFALIAPMNVGGSGPDQSRWLSVHKVDAASGKGCLVGMVDAKASPQAGDMARRLADEAATKSCPNTARIVGKRGDRLRAYEERGGFAPWRPERKGFLGSGTTRFAAAPDVAGHNTIPVATLRTAGSAGIPILP